MKKPAKIFLAILLSVIGVFYLIKDDLQVWYIVEKYREDPLSFNPLYDFPSRLNAPIRDGILDVYFEQQDTTTANLYRTIHLIDFFRMADFEVSEGLRRHELPFHPKSFDVLMDIYSRIEDKEMRAEITFVLNHRNINAFYKAYHLIENQGLPFYDSYGDTLDYPYFHEDTSSIERALWCGHVEPRITARFIRLLTTDTIDLSFDYEDYIYQYERANCSDDSLKLGMLYFKYWVDRLVNLEANFEKMGYKTLNHALYEGRVNPKNMLDRTSLHDIVTCGFKFKYEEEMLARILDYPIQCKHVCLEICDYYSFYCMEHNPFDEKILAELGKWLDKVDRVYPDLNIHKVWNEHQKHDLDYYGKRHSWAKITLYDEPL